MADAFVEALFEVVAPHDVRSITAKGSSRKPWDSPIDYVPAFSDVDIHVLFTAAPDPDRYYLSLEQGLRMQESLEQGYRSRIPNPIHVPRLQFIPANVLERETLFVPSPPSTVDVLYGKPYEPPAIDEEKSRSASRALLVDYQTFLTAVGEHVSEKSTPYLWDLLRQLTWRVAPAGPRALEVMGVPNEKAWGGNRSAVVRLLEDAGQKDLAESYALFYLSEWDFFLSGYTDAAAGRAIVRSGARVLALARSVAEEGH